MKKLLNVEETANYLGIKNLSDKKTSKILSSEK